MNDLSKEFVPGLQGLARASFFNMITFINEIPFGCCRC